MIFQLQDCGIILCIPFWWYMKTIDNSRQIRVWQIVAHHGNVKNKNDMTNMPNYYYLEYCTRTATVELYTWNESKQCACSARARPSICYEDIRTIKLSLYRATKSRSHRINTTMATAYFSIGCVIKPLSHFHDQSILKDWIILVSHLTNSRLSFWHLVLSRSFVRLTS